MHNLVFILLKKIARMHVLLIEWIGSLIWFGRASMCLRGRPTHRDVLVTSRQCRLSLVFLVGYTHWTVMDHSCHSRGHRQDVFCNCGYQLGVNQWENSELGELPLTGGVSLFYIWLGGVQKLKRQQIGWRWTFFYKKQARYNRQRILIERWTMIGCMDAQNRVFTESLQKTKKNEF